MSIEHDQSTRHQMRSGITGENVLRPLDDFSVTTTEKPDVPVGYWEALDKAFKEAVPLTEPGRDFYTYGFEATLWSVTPDGQIQIQPISHRTMMLDIKP